MSGAPAPDQVVLVNIKIYCGEPFFRLIILLFVSHCSRNRFDVGQVLPDALA